MLKEGLPHSQKPRAEGRETPSRPGRRCLPVPTSGCYSVLRLAQMVRVL